MQIWADIINNNDETIKLIQFNKHHNTTPAIIAYNKAVNNDKAHTSVLLSNDRLNQTKQKYSIDDICNMTNLPSVPIIDIIICQNIACTYFKKYIKGVERLCYPESGQNNEIQYIDNDKMKILYWLDQSSKYLANKLKMPQINLDKSNNDNTHTGIHRSSYKFCENGYMCKFNYKLDKNKPAGQCHSHHFVHNYLNYDVNNIINYIKSRKTMNDINFDELLKCINTMSFVINHMTEEMIDIEKHYGDCDKYHVDHQHTKHKNNNNPRYNSNNATKSNKQTN